VCSSDLATDSVAITPPPDDAFGAGGGLVALPDDGAAGLPVAVDLTAPSSGRATRPPPAPNASSGGGVIATESVAGVASGGATGSRPGVVVVVVAGAVVVVTSAVLNRSVVAEPARRTGIATMPANSTASAALCKRVARARAIACRAPSRADALPRDQTPGRTAPAPPDRLVLAFAVRASGSCSRPQLRSPKVDDEDAMRLALAEAALAAEHGDIPVGAVVIVGDDVVAQRHNERERTGDPTAHAELLALRDAATVVGDGWRLVDATLVVTLEPCPMCAGALVAARVHRVVFGAADPKAGACGSLYNLCTDPRLAHEVEVAHGVLAAEAGALLTSFFASRR